MISISPKPLLRKLPVPKLQRLPKWKSMSINLGRLCVNGVIVLADTYSYRQDGTAKKDGKILHFDGKCLAFAIADASDDANAAKTLLTTIGNRLASEASNWKEVETIVKAEMTDWHKAFKKAPATLFTGGILLKGKKPECRLYSLEPPRTVEIHSDGYVANGAGSWITDLLSDLLYDGPNPAAHPQLALREAIYLLYRADKANVFCRGIDGYFINATEQRLQHLDVAEIKKAMSTAFQIDTVLSSAISVTLGGGQWLSHNADSVRSLVMACNKLRNTVFHDVTGQEICIPK